MFFKIPLNADLANTSFRCHKCFDDAAYIEYNSGAVSDDWKEISREEVETIAPEWFCIPEAASDEVVTTEEAQESQLAYLVMKAKGSATA